MSTSTDQEFVTVPFDNSMLQKILLAQLAMQKQAQTQGQGQSKPQLGLNTAKPTSGSLANIQTGQPKLAVQQQKPQIKPSTAPSWGNMNPTKPQPQTGQIKLNNNGQVKPQLKPATQNIMIKKETTAVIEEKKEQGGQNGGMNLAFLGQIAQMAAAGGANPSQVALLNSLIGQIGAQNNNNNNNNNTDGNDGGRPFKYSSQGGNQQGNGGFNNRNGSRPPFDNNRGNRFNNDRGNRGGFNNNNGRFGNNGRVEGQQGGNFRGRRPFGNNNGGRGNRDQDDFSRSRTREKSQNFAQNNRRFNNNQDGENNENGDFSNNRGPPRPMNTRPGDWDCPGCNNLNYSNRRQCNRCGIDKPQELIDQEELNRKGPVFKKGDWYCVGCKNLNFAKRVNCNRCGNDRPEETMEDFKPSMRNSARNENQFDENQDQGEMMNQKMEGGNDEPEEGEVW